MTVEEMTTKFLERIERYPGTSFVELVREAGDEAEGDRVLELLPNLVLWNGVSEKFAKALNAARESGRIEMVGTTTLVYFIDGEVPMLPVAKRPPKKGYKEPHWAPVVFNPVES